MILPYQDIITWAKSGGIVPFEPACVNAATIDLRWSGRFCMPLMSKARWSDTMYAERLVLPRGEFRLLDTLEYITMPDDYAGMVMLKSSSGRNGLEHLHAGLFDPSFPGTATLEVENRHPYPLVIEREQRIVQLVLMKMSAVPEINYLDVGHYAGQKEPTGAR